MCRQQANVALLVLVASISACNEPRSQSGATPGAASSRPSETRGNGGARGTAPERDYEAHLAKLKPRLPHDGFAYVVEPPFVVIAEGGREVAERWAKGTVRWAVQKLKQDFFALDPEVILDIWLFDTDRSYRRHAKQLFGESPSTPFGYYSRTHRALVMNIATGGGTLVHEIVHPYVAANFSRCPAWLNEGLGSLFEQSSERDGHIVGLTNWRLKGLQEAIREQRMVAIPSLLATTDAEFYGVGSGLHYAMARYLLYWLQQQGKLRQLWQVFRKSVADDPTGLAAFKDIAGVTDVAEFQKEWEAFVLRLKFE